MKPFFIGKALVWFDRKFPFVHSRLGKKTCDAINQFGEGQHPFADAESLPYFRRRYIRKCVKRRNEKRRSAIKWLALHISDFNRERRVR